MKKILLLSFMLNILMVNAQELEKVHPNWYEPEDPETVFFDLSIYMPIGLSDSSLGKDYEFNPGFQFGVNVFLTPEIIAGIYGKWYKAEVANIEKIGNISSTNLSEYGLSLGYYHALNRELNFLISFGIGGVSLNNSVNFSSYSFRENGTSYKFNGELGYRFNQTIALFAKISPYYTKLQIDNTTYNEYLNKHFLVDVGFGIRVHLHNPNG